MLKMATRNGRSPWTLKLIKWTSTTLSMIWEKGNHNLEETIKKCPEGATRFRTKVPDRSHLDHLTCDWACSVHGDSKEEVPPDMPILRGKPVRTTTFENANVMQDLTTGRSVTDVLHLVNSTPIDWHCKSQGSTGKATCGSEFVAARLATKQIMDLQCTLLHLMAKLACSVTMKVSSLVPLFGIHP
jgi:hypothetical protein